MAVDFGYIVSMGRRKERLPPGWDYGEWCESLPEYTKRQINEVHLDKVKVER